MHTVPKKVYGSLAGMSAITAGILHITLVAQVHKGVAPEWFFFIVIGVAQLVWAFWFYKNQKELFHHIGIVLNGALLSMWIFTRIFPAPFLNAPEHVDPLGIILVTIELIAIVALILWHNPTHTLTKFFRKFASAIGISIVVGLLLYGGSIIAAKTIFSTIEITDHHGKPIGDDVSIQDTNRDTPEIPTEEKDTHVDIIPHD